MIYVSNRYDADDLDCWADDILMQWHLVVCCKFLSLVLRDSSSSHSAS